MRLSDLRLRTKLFLSFGLVVLLGLLASGVAVLAVKRTSDAAAALGAHELPAVSAALSVEKAIRGIQRDVRQGMLVNGAAGAAAAASYAENRAQLDSAVQQLAGLATDAGDSARLGQLRTAVQAWLPFQDRIVELTRAGRSDQAREVLLSPENSRAVAEATRAADAIADDSRSTSAAAVTAIAATASRARVVSLAMAAFAVLVGVLVSVTMARAIGVTAAAVLDRMTRLREKCVTGLENGIVGMARGDLSIQVTPTTTPVDVTSKDELGQIAETFNAMLGQMKSAIGAFGQAQRVVRDAVTETQRLVESAKAGQLATRGDAARYEGSFRELVGGINATLDAVVAPVNEAADVLERMARRDLTARVQGAYQGDHARIKDSVNTAAEEMQRALVAIAQNAQSLAASSEELSATATQMGSGAEETSTQATVVSAAAEQVSRNVQTVATATEEMTASIREIAKNASEASKVATQAVEAAEKTNATVAQLGESSQQIGAVIKVITSIAEQTNLLALNATIEAARAGEAGKGFAVVANEVKELAKETAKATEEIGRTIEAIQRDAAESAGAIRSISEIIRRINDIQATIAGAVEEQTATTNEMGRNVAEAAKGTHEIAENISGVATAARETSTGAQASQQASRSLAQMAAELDSLVNAFVLEERAPRERALARGGRAAVTA